jgi:hypothetical protein
LVGADGKPIRLFSSVQNNEEATGEETSSFVCSS